MLNYLYSRKINYGLVFSLIFAIISRSFIEWILFDFASDKKVQIATAFNFLNGNGISLAYVEANDLSNMIFEKVGLWPPGFALSIAPLLKTGMSPIRASIFLDIIAIFILFYSFFLVFKLLKPRIHIGIPIFFFIFFGLSLQPFNVLFSSGLIALSICILAIYFLIRNINYEIKAVDWFCLGILAFLPSFFHFSYYPISIVLPFLFLLYSIFIDISKRRAAISNFSLCLCLIAAQLYYQASLPTGINYLNEYHPDTTGSPYWENLRMFINLPIYLLTDGFVLKRTIGRFYNELYIVISIPTWLMFIYSIFHVKKHLYKKYKDEGLNFLKQTDAQFIMICLILSWLVIIFLTFLSLKYPAEDLSYMPNRLWTYVVEARYFSLIIMLLPLAVAIGCWKQMQKPIIKIIFSIVVFAGFAFSSSINLYYLFKYGSGSPEENYSRYHHHSYDFKNFLETKLENAEGKLIVYTPELEVDEYSYYTIMNQIPLLRLEELQKELKTSVPVKVLINLSDKLELEEKIIIENLVENYQLQPIKEFPDLGIKLYELQLP